MSNVAIAHPNRLLEYKSIHQNAADWNVNLPLANILTDVLPETARTNNSVKTTTFGISLSALPYRNLSAIALVNHNLSTSAKVKFTIFNEPPLCYCQDTLVIPINSVATDDYPIFLPIGLSSLVNHYVKIHNVHKSRVHSSHDEWIYGKVKTHNLSTGEITLFFIYKRSDNLNAGGQFNQSIVFDLGVLSAEQIATQYDKIKITNVPQWLDCWQRINPVDSPNLTWRSRNFWRGTIELEIMELVTKVHISFLKTANNLQPLGTHLNIAIDDSQEPQTWSDGTTNPNYSPYIELGRVFMGGYMEATINPEYGSITHGVKDTTEFQQADSGQKFFHEKSRARTVSVQWNHLDKDEAFGSLLLSQLQQGISREVLYTYSVEKIDTYQLLQSFIGRYVDLSPIQQPNVGLYSASINLEEIL